jgi:hypothetical protein
VKIRELVPNYRISHAPAMAISIDLSTLQSATSKTSSTVARGRKAQPRLLPFKPQKETVQALVVDPTTIQFNLIRRQSKSSPQ